MRKLVIKDTRTMQQPEAGAHYLPEVIVGKDEE